MSLNKTSIEWVKNPDGTQGYTWNPITGCLNGCEYCYAKKLANGRLRSRYLANTNIANPILSPSSRFPPGYSPYEDPFYPRFWAERLGDPMARMVTNKKGWVYYAGKDKGIFVCDMGELFGDWVPSEWQDKILEVIEDCPGHRFYLLTKQPQNLIKFSPFPDNCWVGVTATNCDELEVAVSCLLKIKARIKYVSAEPLLAPLSKYEWLYRTLDWLIIGAQTKPYKPPRIEWVQEIVEACNKAGIPVFLKDNLKQLLQQNKHNLYSFPEWAGTQFAITGDHSLSPNNPHPNEAMRKLRQEMPR